MRNQGLCKIILIFTFVIFTLKVSFGGFPGAGTCHARYNFSVEEERRLGDRFEKELENHLELIKDPSIQGYIDRIGKKITSQIDYKPFDFNFHVYVASDPNAFAIPAGYIYISSGLIIMAENESELAGVMSHEIAHVTARHIAEKIEKERKLSIGTLAAILAGLFLGGSGKAAGAIGAFSMATAQTLSLKYTRENEEEADRLGLGYLIGAGYDGSGLIGFLEKMKRHRLQVYQIPQYLLTHPEAETRVDYLDVMLRRFPKQKEPEGMIEGFQRVQVKVMVHSRSPEHAREYFESALESNPGRSDLIYGLALANQKLGNYDEAIEGLNQALTIYPDDSEILSHLGVCHFSEGRTDDAISVLERSVANDQRNTSALYYLGRSYQEKGRFNEAIKVYHKLKRLNAKHIDVYYNLGVAYGKAGHMGESHRSFGTFFKLKNKWDSALFHFNRALKYYSNDTKEKREILREIKMIKGK